MNFQNVYNIRGSAGSPVTLTNSFVACNPIFARYMKKFHLEGTYTPASNNSLLLVLVEYSNDDPNIYPNGGPTHWRPLTVQVAATQEVDLFADDGTAMSTASGIPIIIPGDKTSVAARAINWDYDQEDLNAQWIRFSFKEIAAGGGAPVSFGTTDAEVSIQNI